MSLKITHKYSTAAGTPPASGDIDVGEIAINAADAELYVKDNAGNIRKFQNTTTGTADGVNFTQAGTNAVQRTVESKLQDVVSVLDFIPEGEHAAIRAGTSTYDATTAIQAAINAVTADKGRKTLLIPGGKYKITSTLTIDQPNVCIIGLGMPSRSRGDDSSSETRGATIRYYGTGTAIQIGLDPGNNGNFIQGVRIENLRIEVDDNTLRALYVWHASGSYFKNIKIFGNKGSNRYGLDIRGGIDNIYEEIFITGLGQTPGANSTEYLYAGLHARLGYLNDTITTTVFRRCYFHYCNHAAFIDYQVDFEDCVFEASRRGVQAASFALSSFNRCWWEANTDRDFSLNNSEVDFTDCEINAYTRQIFGSFGGGVKRASFKGTRFNTSDANPQLVPSGENICLADGSIIFSSCSLPTNFKLGGTGSQTLQGYDKIVVSDMRLAIYRFKATSVSGAITSNPMPTEGGLTSYTMPTSGHMLGLNIYASAAVTAGTVDIATRLNGTGVTNFSYPFPFNFSAFPASWKRFPYDSRFNAGDVLTIYFHTSGISPTVDFTYEVIVALGPDGL